MKPSPNIISSPDPDRRIASGSAEQTLRLIATLPPPDGLVDRVHEGLRVAPRSGRILRWPDTFRPAGGWMHSTMVRGAAAAAIVCVVAGGGWRIYSQVQPASTSNVIVMPPRVAPESRGFAGAGAVRVPQTLDGPMLTHPVKAPTVEVVQTTPASSAPILKKKKPGKTVVVPRQ